MAVYRSVASWSTREVPIVMKLTVSNTVESPEPVVKVRGLGHSARLRPPASLATGLSNERSIR
jgi:hypothetical protein